MTTEYDELGMFQEAYLEYLEGVRDAPPTLDSLSGNLRRAAEAFIETVEATRGIDPFASRPSIEKLLESNSEVATAPENLRDGLQNHLRQAVDSEARVDVDTSGATGLGSTLVIQARGIRIRVVEGETDDLGETLARKADNIARVFSTSPDCQAVLYTTGGRSPRGVVLVRGDVYDAIETPSGAQRPPRLPRAVMGAATACEVWLNGLIPKFKPLSRGMLETAISAESSPDALDLAIKVVGEVSAAGARARVQAKREAWGEFGDREAERLAALVEEARGGRLSPEDYRSRVDELSRMAA